jgi:hypothetical protein
MTMSCASGRLAISINGSVCEVANGVSPPEIISKLTLGGAFGGGGEFNGHIRRLQIVPHQVSDGLLAALSEQ